MLNTTFEINYFGISDIGLVREHNEDVWLACPEKGLFLLADGMGGHAAGEVAAKEAVGRLSQLLMEWGPPKDATLAQAEAFFRDAVTQVNEWVYYKGHTDSTMSGMGTTLCALLFMQGHVILAHVGDSRIYRYRRPLLRQLTEDHSLASELLALGAMDTKDIEKFPYKHILTRAIGTHQTVEPTMNAVEIEPNDLFLICSDGLTNYVTDKEMAAILSQKLSLKERGHQLIDLAKEHGGGDNITVVLAQLGK